MIRSNYRLFIKNSYLTGAFCKLLIYLNILRYKISVMKNVNDLIEKVQNELTSASVNDILEFSNVDERVTDSIHGENGDIDESDSVDYAGFTENGDILILEFHTGRPNDELSKKLLRYSTLLFLKYCRKVIPYAVCTESVDEDKISFRWGENNIFTYRVICSDSL